MRIGIAGAAIVVAAATVKLVRSVEQNDAAPPVAAPAKKTLPAMDETAWGETHPSIHMHPELDFDPAQDPATRDTSLTPRVVTELPLDIVENGGVLHFLVTQPEWEVFDAKGQILKNTDEVVLTVSDPDKGIGLELTRFVINPHQVPADRKWHSFDLKVPQCTRRLRLEALKGLTPDANTYSDHLWVSVRESLTFRRAGNVEQKLAPPQRFSCPEATLLRDCPKATKSKCDDAN